jgi:hypothetical protein
VSASVQIGSTTLAFPADFNDSTVLDFSASIVRLQVG